MIPKRHEQLVFKLIKWAEGKQAYPDKIIIAPTFKCNLICLFCGEKDQYDIKKELSSEEWNRIVTEAGEMKVTTWSITGGGEPLLRKDLTFALMQKIKNMEHETRGMLTTNGLLFSEEDIKKLVKIGWDEIYFSMDSCKKSTNNFLRNNKLAYQKVVAAIKLFNKIKKKNSLKKPSIIIQAVINNYNYKEIPEFVDFAYKLGCDSLSLNEMRIINPRKFKKYDLYKPNINDVFNRIRKAKKRIKHKRFKLDIDLKEYEENEFENINKNNQNLKPKKNIDFSKIHCYEPFFTVYINPHGEVAPCCPYSHGFEGLNIKNKKLKEVWFNNKLKKLRENLKKNILLDKCSVCNDNLQSKGYIKAISRYSELINKPENLIREELLKKENKIETMLKIMKKNELNYNRRLKNFQKHNRQLEEKLVEYGDKIDHYRKQAKQRLIQKKDEIKKYKEKLDKVQSEIKKYKEQMNKVQSLNHELQLGLYNYKKTLNSILQSKGYRYILSNIWKVTNKIKKSKY